MSLAVDFISTELLIEWNLIGCGCPEVLNDKTKILASGLESSSLKSDDYIKAVSDDRMPSETESALENIWPHVLGGDIYLN